MRLIPLARIRHYLLLSAAVLILSACQIESKPASELDQIKQRGVLRVGTLNNQLSYYIGPDGQAV